MNHSVPPWLDERHSASDARPPDPPLPSVADDFEGIDAQRYERLAPRYPASAFALVMSLLASRPQIADIGAGTGQLASGFVARGAEVIAVEPASTLRAELRRLQPSVAVVAGLAEAIPLRDHCVSAVVVGSAFHLFDSASAISEVTRILQHDGLLAIFTGRYAHDDVVWQTIAPIVERFNRGRSSTPWRQRLRECADLAMVEEPRIASTHPVAAKDLAATLLLWSGIASLPRERRDEFARKIDHLSTTFTAHLALRYTVEVSLWRKR